MLQRPPPRCNWTVLENLLAADAVDRAFPMMVTEFAIFFSLLNGEAFDGGSK